MSLSTRESILSLSLHYLRTKEEISFALFEFLFANGGDVNYCDPAQQNSPMHIAVLLKSYTLVFWLKSKGAEPFVKNKAGLLPTNYGNDEIKDLIYKMGFYTEKNYEAFAKEEALKISPIIKPKNLVQLLLLANHYGIEPTAKQLENIYLGISSLEAKDRSASSPYYFENEPLNPIHVAALAGFQNTVNWLLSKGDDINRTTASGRTPLLFSIYKKHAKVADFLIRLGANVNLFETDAKSAKHSPLIIAAFNALPTTIKLLLQNNADIYHQDSEGSEALQIAKKFYIGSLQNRAKTIELLTKRKFEIESTAVYNTVLAACNTKQEPDTAALEKSYYRDTDINYCDPTNQQNSAAHLAAAAGFNSTLNWLSEKGAHLEIENENRCTPLHFAAHHDKLSTCDLLINEHKADVNKQDIYGRSTLHFSIGGKHEKLSIWLIKHANPNLSLKETKFLYEPIHLAIIRNLPKVIGELITHQASLRWVSLKGNPLQLAQAKKIPELADYIKNNMKDANSKYRAEDLLEYAVNSRWSTISEIMKNNLRFYDPDEARAILTTFFELVIAEFDKTSKYTELDILLREFVDSMPIACAAQALRLVTLHHMTNEPFSKKLKYGLHLLKNLRDLNASFEDKMNLLKEFIFDQIHHVDISEVAGISDFLSKGSEEVLPYFTRSSYLFFRSSADWDKFKEVANKHIALRLPAVNSVNKITN